MPPNTSAVAPRQSRGAPRQPSSGKGARDGTLLIVRGPEMALTPPSARRARQSRGAPRSAVSVKGAPRWPLNYREGPERPSHSQALVGPAKAVARLDHRRSSVYPLRLVAASASDAAASRERVGNRRSGNTTRRRPARRAARRRVRPGARAQAVEHEIGRLAQQGEPRGPARARARPRRESASARRSGARRPRGPPPRRIGLHTSPH